MCVCVERRERVSAFQTKIFSNILNSTIPAAVINLNFLAATLNLLHIYVL